MNLWSPPICGFIRSCPMLNQRAVEKAIEELKSRNETITFKAVAVLASVRRQYLYNNFKTEISAFRNEDRATSGKIEGITVPNRQPDEHRHIEALLINNIDKQKEEFKNIKNRKRKAQPES